MNTNYDANFMNMNQRPNIMKTN